MMKKFSELFHISSKDHMRGRLAAGDAEKISEELRTVHFKTYPRLPRIALPRPELSADFFSLLRKRRSRRKFSREDFSLEDIGALLLHSCGETGDGQLYHRAQPSGGGRFPVEAYLLLFKRFGADVPPGVYHYAVSGHALELIWEREFSAEDIGRFFTYPWVKDAAAALVLTSIFERSQAKYGERGYRYILIEAGHIGQNASLVSEALGLSCCALGGTYDIAVEELLDIDGRSESVVYALAFGGRTPGV